MVNLEAKTEEEEPPDTGSKGYLPKYLTSEYFWGKILEEQVRKSAYKIYEV